MRDFAAKANTGLAWLIFAGANILFFLIALSVFGAASSEVHANGGRILMLLALLATIAALVARSSGLNIGVTLLMTVLLFPGQGMLAYLEFPMPWMNALHAVSGLTIMYLAYSLANGRARATRPIAQDAASLRTAEAD